MRRGKFTRSDYGWVNGIVESLARHRKERARTVLAWLQGQYGDEDPGVMEWLQPCFVDIAAKMRLEEAVPLLLDYVGHETDLSMADSADRALPKIGGDLVVRQIDARWRHTDNIEFHRAAACILDHVRGDFCIERCLDFFDGEDDHETKLMLGSALLGNFSEEAIDPLWTFLAHIDEDRLEPDERDLQYRLVAVCEIMGRTFPLFEEWHKAALRDNWGRFDLKPGRVADTFRPEVFGPKWSEN